MKEKKNKRRRILDSDSEDEIEQKIEPKIAKTEKIIQENSNGKISIPLVMDEPTKDKKREIKKDSKERAKITEKDKSKNFFYFKSSYIL